MADPEPEYWQRRRESNPALVEHNRQLQRVRDQKRKLRDLANNNSAFDLQHSATNIWLVGAGLDHLANNNVLTWIRFPLDKKSRHALDRAN